jgi:hypothetical protein
MATAFSRQFDTGIPFHQPPAAPVRALPFNVSVPRLPEEKTPTEDPAEEPTKNPNTSNTKQSNPAAQPHSISKGSNFWGNIGKDIGIGAAGLATAGGAALGVGKSLGGTVGDTAVDLGKEGLELGQQTLKNGSDIAVHEAPQVGRNILNWGEDAGKGIGEAASSANSFLESTGSGNGLVNAVQGSGRFSPGAPDGPPAEGGLKIPDSWSSVSGDLGALADAL